MNFPNKEYQVIYADPPWQFDNHNTGGNLSSGAGQKYDVMTVEDICNLPVKDITDKDCALFMWWVSSMPEEALQVMKAWGFTLKTMTGFDWVKRTKYGKLHFGMGFWTRQGSEHCLIAVKGHPKRIDAGIRAILETEAPDLETVIDAEVEEHSKKPYKVRIDIVELMGDVPRIELFARERALGWDSWGNGLEPEGPCKCCPNFEWCGGEDKCCKQCPEFDKCKRGGGKPG
jgi:N6-adenosine-specific RNA methylase IME4